MCIDGAQVRCKLRALQASVKGPYLRQAWCTYHRLNTYDSYKEEWELALKLMTAPSEPSAMGHKAAPPDTSHASASASGASDGAKRQ